MKKIENQHGDVCLERVDKVPDGAIWKPVNTPEFVIERGEGTNTHVIECEGNLIDISEVDGYMYVRVKPGKQVRLVHKEHGTQILKGVYRKKIERTYDYAQNEERRVID